MHLHFYEVPGGVRCTETESRGVGAREGGGSDCLMGRVSVLQDEKVMEMHIAANNLPLLNCTLTSGQDGKFYFTCTLPQLKRLFFLKSPPLRIP